MQHFEIFILTDGSPAAAAIGLRYLASLGVIGQIHHQILEHLRPGALLHAGEFRCRIRGPLPVDDLG